MSSPQPDVTVVVPCYDRESLLAYSLESVRRARGGLDLQVLVVDDGSRIPLSENHPAIRAVGGRVIRQANQGLLFARLRGFEEVRGRYVLFLDTDDLVSVDKLTAQVRAMDAVQADVSYTDSAKCLLSGAYDDCEVVPDQPAGPAQNAAELFIHIQPPPHGPLWRTAYLSQVVRHALFAPDPAYNCVAEIWFYHNAAPRPTRAIFVPGPYSIVGQHAGPRLTNNWERLGVASLAVMEAFERACPRGTPEADQARQCVAEKSFLAWRRLPRDFHAEYSRRLLGLWRRLAVSRSPARLGGKQFRALAAVIGPVATAKLFRLFQAPRYQDCRTLTDEEFEKRMKAIPAHA